jgi:alkaline phosphatase
MATGSKTLNGRVSIDIAGLSLPTILEQAQKRGWAVGLVSTVQIAHATPAAFAAHELSRYNYSQIAEQMLEHQVNVLLAGGEDDWLPETVSGCHPNLGHRTDGRNLIAEAVLDGYTYVCSPADLASVDLENTTHLLGLFADDGMRRPYTPTLSQMTETAITILSQDPDGFFLMVEGGQIDWAAHVNDGANVISDVLDFDAAVATGLAYTQSNANALLIVTADHETGGMSVDLTSSGNPDEDGPFWMPDGTPFYINWTTINHTGGDVPVAASGPKSEMLIETYENTHIYETMHLFLGWQVNLPIIHK